MQIIFEEFSAMNNLNSLLNLHQNSSLHEFHNNGGNFDPAPSHDEFLDKMLSSVPSTTASFPRGGADDHSSILLGHLGDQSTATKMRQKQISNTAAKALMLQQQLMLSAADDFRSPSGADTGLLLICDHNDVVSGRLFLENDSSIKPVFNGFNGLLGQISNQHQHFHHIQSDNFGVIAATETAGGGEVVGQARQKPRAKRGQATDRHSIAERLRREKIAERMNSLQEIVPNANKTDKASMLDEIIDYVKFLQLQVKVLSMSRLGGATAVAPLVGEQPSQQGKSRNVAETASSSQNDEGMTVAEQQVAKLMEDDMGAAMQYLQGKGLCLMSISLATAISTTKPPLNGEAGGPTSPSMSVSTVQSAPMGGGSSGGQHSVKGSTSVS